MSQVLVTGASGFIGRAVVTAFAKDGNIVRAAVRAMPEPPFADGVAPIIHRDLTDPIDWQPLIAGIDIVIHLAGIAHIGSGVGPSSLRPRESACDGAACTSGHNGRSAPFCVCFVDSRSIRTECRTRSNRARSRTSERSLRPFKARRRTGRARVRRAVHDPAAGSALWSGREGKFCYASAHCAVASCRCRLQSFGNRRSLLGIENFISALTFALEAPNTLGETYIVADPGMAPSLAEMMVTLRKAQGRTARLIPIPTAALSIPLRLLGRGDLWQRIGGDLQANPGKLIAAGWRPKHSTTDGLTALASRITS